MNIYAVHDSLIQIAATAPTVTTGMNSLLDYCDTGYPSPVWDGLRSLDYEADVAALRTWFWQVLEAEPPSPNVKGFWFGLFESLEDGVPIYILYVSGSVEEYTSENEGWACWKDDSYLPENRYSNSQILKTLAPVLHSEPDAVELGEYVLCLGYACLAVPLLMQTLSPDLLLGGAERRAVTVGFDEADVNLLGYVTSQGWSSAVPAIGYA